MYKFLQRRTYTFLNTCWGFSLVLILGTLIAVSIIFRIGSDPRSLRGASDLFYSTYDFRDNISGKHVEALVSYGSIDVVYTWVNGSDPVWQKKKEIWAEKARRDSFVFVDHSTLFNTTEANSTAPASEDDTMSSNRYRDSEELRYSLRSLLQHAPWIRHIYLVTDNQIPNWLNLETSKLSIVTHEEIFANASHLPVFSSPAIEANIHHIPGLSKKFIYFNDDVFLGRPITPADFVALEQSIQHFVMAWDVPKCAPGCSESWIGDGFCDKACNVSSCNFDFPDCINGTNVPGSPNYQSTSAGGAQNAAINNAIYCSTGCPESWLHDKICDMRCNHVECGYDLGDCGIDLVYDNYPNAVLYERNSILYGHGVQPEDKTVVKSEVVEDFFDYTYGMQDYYMSEEEYFPLRSPQQTNDERRNHTEVSNNDTTTFVSGDMDNMNTTSATISTHHSSGFVRDDDVGFSAYRHRHRTAHPRKVSTETAASNTVSKKEEFKPALQVMYGTKAVYFDISSLPCYLFHNYANAPMQSISDTIIANNQTTIDESLSMNETSFVPTFSPTAAPTTSGSIPYIKTIQTPQHHQYQCPFLNGMNVSDIPFQYTQAISTDSNNQIVQHANILSRHHLLTVLLYHGQADVVVPTQYPLDVWFTITGEWVHSYVNEVSGNKETKTFTANLQFLLRIEDPKTFETYAAELQKQHGLVSPLPQIKHQYTQLYFAEPLVNVSMAKNHSEVDANILAVPMIKQENREDIENKKVRESVIVSVLYNEHSHLHSHHVHHVPPIGSCNLIPWSIVHTNSHPIDVQLSLTLFNGTKYLQTFPLKSSLISYDDITHSFEPILVTEETHKGDFLLLQKSNQAYEQFTQSFFAEYAANIQSPPTIDSVPSADGHSDATKISPNDMLLHLRTVRKQLNGNNGNSAVVALTQNVVKRRGILLSIPLPFTAKDIAPQYISLHADVVLKNASSEASQVLYSIGSLFEYGSPQVTAPPTEAKLADEIVVNTSNATNSHIVTLSAENTTSVDEAFVGMNVTQSTNATNNISNNVTVDSNNATAHAEIVSRRLTSRLESWWTSLTDYLFKPFAVIQIETKEISNHHIVKNQVRRRLASITPRREFSSMKHHANPVEVAAFTRKLSELLEYAAANPNEFANSFEEYYYSSREISPLSKAPFTSSSLSHVSYDNYHAYQHRRRLVDTYASSLIYVNRLYNKKFGTESRKVPAHVPHMIDREYMTEMQSIWKDEWSLTSSHRFRHEQDMQYAFAYYYYALNRHKLLAPTNSSLPSLESVVRDVHAKKLQAKKDLLKNKRGKSSGEEEQEKVENTLERDRNGMIEKFIRDFVDHNNDRHIDYNELRTLLILFTQKEYHVIPNETIEEVNNCVKNITNAVGTLLSEPHFNAANNPDTSAAHVGHGHQGSISPQPSHTTTTISATTTGHTSLQTQHYLYPTIPELLTCPAVVNLYIAHVHPVYSKYYPLSTTLADRELVAFEMISDNMTTALSQLDSIRMRQNKFICLNDNMQNPTPELVAAVQQFLSSMFPMVSPFELPPGQRNPTLYVDEYRRMFPNSLGAFSDNFHNRPNQQHRHRSGSTSQMSMPEDWIDWFIDTLIDSCIYLMKNIDQYIIQTMKKALIQVAYWIIEFIDEESSHSSNGSSYDAWAKHSSKSSGRVRVSTYNTTTTASRHAPKQSSTLKLEPLSSKVSAAISTAASRASSTSSSISTESVAPVIATRNVTSADVSVKANNSPGKSGVDHEHMVQAALWIMVLGVFALIYVQRQLAYQQQKQRADVAAAATATATLSAVPAAAVDHRTNAPSRATNNTGGTLPVVIPPSQQYLAPIPKFKGATTSTPSKSIPPPPSSIKKSSGTPPAGSRKTVNPSSTANTMSKLLGLSSATTNTAPSMKNNKNNKNNNPPPQKKLIVVEEDYLTQLEAAQRKLQQLGGNGNTSSSSGNSSNTTGNENNNNANSSSLATKYKQQKLSELDKDDYQEALRMMATYDEEDDEPPITIIPFISNQEMIRTSQSRMTLSTMVEENEEDELKFVNL